MAYIEPLGQFIMLYNSLREPRGIVLRSAPNPWGPWSNPMSIFEEWRDDGYGHFIHISHDFRRKRDHLSDPQREREWGGAYGPYIMERYTKPTDTGCRIFFTMSTWNPYQVVVMQSDLTLPDQP